MSGIEDVYRYHHTTKRGEDFAVLADERGIFLKTQVGSGKKVLDVGCRDGALTAVYVQGNEVTGVDIDSEALRRAHSRLNIKTLHVDLNGNWDSIPKSSFDVVVAAEVIEHVYYPERIFKKVAAVLNSEGMLVGSVPNAFSLKNRLRLFFLQKKGTSLEDPTHINHFTINELRMLLETEFERVHVEGYGRFVWLAKHFPQTFAFGLLFKAVGPRRVI